MNNNNNKNTNKDENNKKNDVDDDKPITDVSNNKIKLPKHQTTLTIFNENQHFFNLHNSSKNIFDNDDRNYYVKIPYFC